MRQDSRRSASVRDAQTPVKLQRHLPITPTDPAADAPCVRVAADPRPGELRSMKPTDAAAGQVTTVDAAACALALDAALARAFPDPSPERAAREALQALA